MLILAFILILLASPAFAGDWQWWNTGLEVADEAMIYADWRTTREFTGSPQEYPNMYEMYKIPIGAYPSARKVNLVMGTWMLIHPLISYSFKKTFDKAPICELWQGMTLAFEYNNVENNKSYNIKLNWHLW
jgi:hypothetical protein